jgi:hypothetical protein
MRLKSVLSTLGIVIALIVGIDYVSFATTGSSAILGKINSANAATTFSRTTSGPAVSFAAKTGSAPFAVNHTTKVSHLNADLLDGKDSTAFSPYNKTKVYRYTASTGATGHEFDIPKPPAGQYLVTYAVPTTLTGGTTTTATLWCEIGQSDGAPFGNFLPTAYTATSSVPYPNATTGGNSGPSLGLSGTAVINTAGWPGAFYVFCNGSANWTTPPLFSFIGTTLAQPAIVTLTKLTNPSNSSASVSKVSTKRAAELRARAGQ